MFRLRRPQKTYAYLEQTVPAGSDTAGGGAAPSASFSTFDGIWPSLGRRHGRKDLHLEGIRQHCAWAIAARVSFRVLARADASASRSVASASCPPRTSAQLMASATRLLGWSRQWTTWSGSSRRCYTSSAWEVPCSWANEASSQADSASVHADTAASGSGSSQSSQRFYN